MFIHLTIFFIMKKTILIFVLLLQIIGLQAQINSLMYAGNTGKETFYDVMQITDGTMLICGYADNLDWIPANVPKYQLTNTGNIHNALGTNRYGFILHLSEDLSQIIDIVHFPQGAVEDIRFMKSTNAPYKPTGDLFISGNTEDTKANDGGYFLARLDHNFINGTPTTLLWSQNIWATSYLKDYHPWDLTSEGETYYVSGEAFGYNWSAIYCLNAMGNRKLVNNWRTHWKKAGGEWRGTPAMAYPGGADSLDYSGIVLKIWGRCDLRSWTSPEFEAILPDGNGGTKKGTWPTDILFNSPCDPLNPTATGPGYTGYSHTAGSPVHGGTCIVVDRRDNHLYIGMNMKSDWQGAPDFEPAVIAMDTAGTLLWWSRLYHEITPAGDTIESLPDQYVDALGIDYAHNKLVVGARCHGNNVENYWEGNTVASNPAAYGFQNQFTGTNGNIHESWIYSRTQKIIFVS